MRAELKNILKELGLNETDTRVFWASLEAGSGAASVIARIAGLNRITTYESLKRLSKSGLVKIRAKKNSSIKYFVAEDISAIEEKLQNKLRAIETSLKQVGVVKKEFRAQFSANTQKPEVLYYEGLDEIKTVLLDTLKQKPDEIISFASLESLESGFDKDFLQQYWNKRVTFGISSRGIIPKTEKAMSFFNAEKNRTELRRVKFVNPDIYQYKNEIDVYGDSIGITSLAKGDEHGIIIRSKNLADSMRAIFETLWHII